MSLSIATDGLYTDGMTFLAIVNEEPVVVEVVDETEIVAIIEEE